MKTIAIQTAALLAALTWLAACQNWSGRVAAPSPPETAAPAFEAQAFRELDRGEGEVFWVDDRDSEVRLFLWRGGPMAAKGHNHVLVVDKMEGAVFLPGDLLSDAVKLSIVFRAADIAVDPPELRRRIGGAWAKPIPPEGVRGTRANMLGAQVLDAERFPTIGLRVEKAYGELPKLVLDTAVTLHGVTRRRLIPVTVSRNNGRLNASGTFVLRQTDFGIEPITAMGGALYAHDPILIEFDIQAQKR